jgi:hypothetical protein
MIPLLLTLLSLIAVTVNFYFEIPWSKQSIPSPNTLAKEPLADIGKVSGNVRVKRAHDIDWGILRRDEKLTADHQIATLANSEATLEFLGSKTKLHIPGNTMLDLGSALSDPGNLRRVFYLESTASAGLSEHERKYATPAFARVHWALKRRPEVAREIGPAKENDLSLSREIKSLARTAPKGDLNLVVSTFPAVVSASFRNPRGKDLVIHGYLWNEETGSDPVWEGTSTGYFASIPINRKGSYVFQAMSEDDTYVSLPWFITAVPLDK